MRPTKHRERGLPAKAKYTLCQLVSTRPRLSLSCLTVVFLATLTMGCERSASRSAAHLSLYLMSSCPFSSGLVRELLPVLDGLGDKVELDVHYIARLEANQLVSMYGPSDLSADRLSLCVQRHEGSAGWRKLMKCQLAYGSDSEDGWRVCGDAAGLNVKALKDCAGGAEGEALLRESVAGATSAHIDASPTLLLNGQRYESGRVGPILARDLCRVLAAETTTYCSSLPVPVPVEVTVVTDNRCKGTACNTDSLIQFLYSTIPGAVIHTLDWSRPEARAVYRQSGQTTLPFVVFSQSVQKESTAFKQLSSGGLSELPTRDGYVLSLGGDFLPDPS